LFSIDELADRAEVSRRTVRFYVQRGLLPAPRGLGRGRHYDASHLHALMRIRAWPEEGVPLALIARRLQAGASEPESQARGAGAGTHPGTADGVEPALLTEAGGAAPVTVWTHVQLAEGVTLQLRDRAVTDDQRRALERAVARILDRRDSDE
jgi:DNA-binding transcriptional MerR regulator